MEPKFSTILKDHRIGVLALFATSIALIGYRCFPTFDFLSGHICSDWFIHYRAGFVRRGFWGTIFLAFDEHALPAARTSIMTFNIAMVSALSYLMYRRSFSLLQIFIVFLGPFGILLCLYNGDYILNKEIFSLACFYTSLIIIDSNLRRSAGNAIIYVLTVIAILNHEVYLFNLLAALIAISYVKRGRSGLATGLAVIGGGLFVLLLIFKGSPELADLIFAGLPEAVKASIAEGKTVYVPDYLAGLYHERKAIAALGWDLRTTLRMMLDMTNILTIFIYIAFTAVVIKFIARFFLDRRSQRYLLISALVSVPLFFIAIDWGRWAFLIFHQVIAYRICFGQELKPLKFRWTAVFLFALYIPPSFTFYIWQDSLAHHALQWLSQIY